MRRPGQWIDRDRAKAVTLGLATDPALSHVLLGAFLASTLQTLLGDGPPAVAVASGLLWALSVALYAVADEMVRRIRERKNRLPESEFYGIE